jgi:O-acetyl-ADP-ribose deacetylase (regulator of RNase III)
MQINFGDSAITLVQGTITGLAVEAIVEISNEPDVQTTVVITETSGLEAKSRITVRPGINVSQDEKFLTDIIQRILLIAEQKEIRSIALPGILVNDLPIERCAKIVLHTTIAFVKTGTVIHHVVFCLQDNAHYGVFLQEFERLIS